MPSEVRAVGVYTVAQLFGQHYRHFVTLAALPPTVATVSTGSCTRDGHQGVFAEYTDGAYTVRHEAILQTLPVGALLRSDEVKRETMSAMIFNFNRFGNLLWTSNFATFYGKFFQHFVQTMAAFLGAASDGTPEIGEQTVLISPTGQGSQYRAILTLDNDYTLNLLQFIIFWFDSSEDETSPWMHPSEYVSPSTYGQLVMTGGALERGIKAIEDISNMRADFQLNSGGPSWSLGGNIRIDGE